MKFHLFAIFALAVLAATSAAAASKKAKAPAKPVAWRLRYTEEFKGTNLNARLWTRLDRGASDWNKNMSTRADLVTVKDGQLHAWGVKNSDLAADQRNVLTGGVSTKGRLAVKYGKIEVRCKLEGAKGAWPAIWMMPAKPSLPWPACGEIDIIERLNFDGFVYHTVHSAWTKLHPADPPHMRKGAIKPDAWNIYGIEWTPERIVWSVNGKTTHVYENPGNDPSRFPWTEPFFLMIDMQLGGKWVGEIDESQLPVAMHVDWVKFYSGSRAGKTFTEFSR